MEPRTSQLSNGFLRMITRRGLLGAFLFSAIVPKAIAEPVKKVIRKFTGYAPYDGGIFYCPYVPLQFVNIRNTHELKRPIAHSTSKSIDSERDCNTKGLKDLRREGHDLDDCANDQRRTIRND